MKGHQFTQELLFSSRFYLLNLKPTQVLLILLSNTKYMPYCLSKCYIECHFYLWNMNWGRRYFFLLIFVFPIRNSIQVLMVQSNIWYCQKKKEWWWLKMMSTAYKEDYTCHHCFKCLFLISTTHSCDFCFLKLFIK